MGKRTFSGKSFARDACAATMSLAMAVTLASPAAFASAVSSDEAGSTKLAAKNAGEEEAVEIWDVYVDEYKILYTGEAVSPKVKAYDRDGNLIGSSAYDLSYERYDEDEDEYSAVQPAQVVEPGEYFVTATAKAGSGYTGETSAEFLIVARTDLDYGRVSAENCTYKGNAVTPKVTVKDAAGDVVPVSAYDLSYERYDEDGYSAVQPAQVVEPGKYRVTATARQGSGYTGEESDTFKIIDAMDLGNGELELDAYRYVADGNPVSPKVTVKSYGDRVVSSNRYELSYEKAIGGDEHDGYTYTPIDPDQLTELGDYRVTATARAGRGYTGKASATFRIVARTDLDEISAGDCTYTGSAVAPEVAVEDAAGDVVPASAYTLSYERYDEDEDEYSDIQPGQVVEPGKYRVTATARQGRGYSGSCSTDFRITDADDLGNGNIFFLDAPRKISGAYYLLGDTPITLKVIVRDKKGLFVDSGKYELTYEKATGEDNEGDYVYSAIGSNRLTEAGEYRVTATAKKGSGYTGKVSAEFTVVAHTDLGYGSLYVDNEDTGDHYACTGNIVTPDVTVSDAAGDAVPASAYELSYERYDKDEDEYCAVQLDQVVEPGEYRVTATARSGSGYTGSCSDTFYIDDPKNLDGASLFFEDEDNEGYYDEYDYKGKPINPKVTVRLSGKDLSPDVYELSYERVIGEGDDDDDESEYRYEPVSENQVIEPGKYRVTATGVAEKGYSGSCSGLFRIVNNKNLENGYLDLNRGRYPKTGKTITLQVSVYFDEDADEALGANLYDLSYEKYNEAKKAYERIQASQVVNAGEYRVTATARKGSGYVGSCSETFTVFERTDLDHGGLSVDSYYLYTGQPIALNLTVRDYDDNVLGSADYTASFEKYDESEYEYSPVAVDDVLTPGEYRVTVTGNARRGYSGSQTATFNIIERTDLDYGNLSVPGSFFSTGKPISLEATVRDAGGDVVPPEDYDLSYERIDDDDDDGGVAVNADEVIEPGEYQVTATGKDGSGYTESCSTTFRIIDEKNISDGDLSLGRLRYPKNGEAIAPDVAVRDCTGKLVDSDAYTLSYTKYVEDEDDPDDYEYVAVNANDVVDAGEYRVTATANPGSGYTGSRSSWFIVFDDTEYHDWITYAGGPYLYTGEVITPQVTVKDSGGNVISPKEYTVSYMQLDSDEESYSDVGPDKIVEPGEYRVTVQANDGVELEGKNWRDYFDVYKATDLDAATLRLQNIDLDNHNEGMLVYAGSGIPANPVLVGVDGKTIDPENYTLSITRNVRGNDAAVDVGGELKPGDYRITASPKKGSGYTGKFSAEFEVVQSDEVSEAGAKRVSDAIAALPTEVASADQQQAVKAAQADYEALGSVGKALVDRDTRSKLNAAVASAEAFAGKQSPQQDTPSTPETPTTPDKPADPTKPDQPQREAVTAATLNAKTVTASAVKRALGANSATVTSITLGKKVNKIAPKAFAGTKATTLVVKTAKLTKKSAKNALKGSKVKTVRVPKAKKKAYKKIFTKKVCGKKVKVK